MKVKTRLNREELERIAQKLGMYLYNYRREGKYHVFTLKPVNTRQERFVRTSYDGRRKIANICLHGYSKFMGEVMKEDPEAVFKSAVAVFGEVRKDNIYSTYIHLRLHKEDFALACVCDDTIHDVEDFLKEIEYEAKPIYAVG